MALIKGRNLTGLATSLWEVATLSGWSGCLKWPIAILYFSCGNLCCLCVVTRGAVPLDQAYPHTHGTLCWTGTTDFALELPTLPFQYRTQTTKITMNWFHSLYSQYDFFKRRLPFTKIEDSNVEGERGRGWREREKEREGECPTRLMVGVSFCLKADSLKLLQ